MSINTRIGGMSCRIPVVASNLLSIQETIGNCDELRVKCSLNKILESYLYYRYKKIKFGKVV